MTRALLCGLCFALGVMAHGSAQAEVQRYAVVIGNDRGDRDEVTLRYAERDAERVGQVLQSVGGFPAENVVT